MEAALYGHVGMAPCCDLPKNWICHLNPKEKLTVNPLKAPKYNLWLCLPQRNRPKKGIYTRRWSSPCMTRGKKTQKKWGFCLLHRSVSFKRKYPSVSYCLFPNGYVLGHFFFLFILQTTTKILEMVSNKNQCDLLCSLKCLFLKFLSSEYLGVWGKFAILSSYKKGKE